MSLAGWGAFVAVGMSGWRSGFATFRSRASRDPSLRAILSQVAFVFSFFHTVLPCLLKLITGFGQRGWFRLILDVWSNTMFTATLPFGQQVHQADEVHTSTSLFLYSHTGSSLLFRTVAFPLITQLSAWKSNAWRVIKLLMDVNRRVSFLSSECPGWNRDKSEVLGWKNWKQSYCLWCLIALISPFQFWINAGMH